MELIDRRKAISHITACDGKSAQIEALENMPTVKAIPLEKLEQIKADIFNACSDKYHMPVYKLDCDEIFEIINKSIKEQSNDD